MKFDYICDNLPDGLVLMDEVYLDELNEDMLYSFEIMLDREGRTELIYDFPGEDWVTVWERESKLIKEFCNVGKMFVLLGDKDIENCEIEFVEHCNGTCISVPSGDIDELLDNRDVTVFDTEWIRVYNTVESLKNEVDYPEVEKEIIINASEA